MQMDTEMIMSAFIKPRASQRQGLIACGYATRHHQSKAKKRWLMLFILCFAYDGEASTCPRADASLSGRYRSVQTSGPVAESYDQILSLRSDGQFFYASSFGSMEASTSGCWRREGKRLIVEATAHDEAAKLHLIDESPSLGDNNVDADSNSSPVIDESGGSAGEVTIRIDNLGDEDVFVDVEYDDGRRIEAQRDDGSSTGGLGFHVKRPGKRVVKRIGLVRAESKNSTEWFYNDKPERRSFLLDRDLTGLTVLDVYKPTGFDIINNKLLFQDALGYFVLDGRSE